MQFLLNKPLLVSVFTCLLIQPLTLLAADPVGEFVFVKGVVDVESADGQLRVAGQGADLYSGDTISTGNSRTQVEFIDGTFVSIQPNTTYKIENYQYEKEDESVASAVFNLVKGGLRAVTGAVTERDPDSYKVNTPVATIGVRGTGHNTRFCQGDCPGQEDGLYHRTWQGITYVANQQGSVNVPAGNAVFVPNINEPIQELDQPSIVNAVQRSEDGDDSVTGEDETTTTYQQGEQITVDGTPTSIGDGQITTEGGLVSAGIALTPVISGEQTGGIFVEQFLLDDQTNFYRDGEFVASISSVEGANFDSFEFRVLSTIDPDAILNAPASTVASEAQSLLQQASASEIDTVNQNPASVVESGSEGSMSWGRWADGNILFVNNQGFSGVQEYTNNQSLHFINGPETNNIPVSGSATYAFAGGTRSTSVDGQTIGQGVTDGYINIFFGNGGSGFINVDILHGGQNYDMAGGLGLGPQGDVIAGTPNVTGGACSTGCDGFVAGGFAGPNRSTGEPEHIGISYGVAVGAEGTSGNDFGGVAGFSYESSSVPQ